MPRRISDIISDGPLLLLVGRQDLELTSSMMQLNQDAKLQASVMEMHRVISSQIAELETKHRKAIREERVACKKRLKDATLQAVEASKRSQEVALDEVARAHGRGIKESEMKLAKVAKLLRFQQDEEQTLRISAARLFNLMKKNNLITEEEGFVAEDDRVTTAELVEEYQELLVEKEDNIGWLHRRLTALQDLLEHHGITIAATRGAIRGMSRKFSPAMSSRRAPSTPGIPPPSDSGDEVGEEWDEGTEAPGEEWDARSPEELEELARIDALERAHEAEVAALAESNARELADICKRRGVIIREWETRIASLMRLHDVGHVDKVIRRQERLMRFAARVKKPRPPCHKEVQVHEMGMTLAMILLDQEGERKRMEAEREEREARELVEKAEAEERERERALQGEADRKVREEQAALLAMEPCDEELSDLSDQPEVEPLRHSISRIDFQVEEQIESPSAHQTAPRTRSTRGLVRGLAITAGVLPESGPQTPKKRRASAVPAVFRRGSVAPVARSRRKSSVRSDGDAGEWESETEGRRSSLFDSSVGHTTRTVEVERTVGLDSEGALIKASFAVRPRRGSIAAAIPPRFDGQSLGSQKSLVPDPSFISIHPTPMPTRAEKPPPSGQAGVDVLGVRRAVFSERVDTRKPPSPAASARRRTSPLIFSVPSAGLSRKQLSDPAMVGSEWRRSMSSPLVNGKPHPRQKTPPSGVEVPCVSVRLFPSGQLPDHVIGQAGESSGDARDKRANRAELYEAVRPWSAVTASSSSSPIEGNC
ncbi:hypothetical protein BDK51DRAFT_43876 [Blyttiomyces helicus]|uniref:Uncharacterized protein n=1 Tax=Blyttiomyces helicus TaxID=388810 RepID=A0A4P9W248_9FUNG|nr:hypothetical protein BDK51DRAFT_43876 [Blyttiomyces helicus]|eukprot:RKO85792.1 hypothetical protein BDK51DRAFT_43876 [Blyttiomyces helicus]